MPRLPHPQRSGGPNITRNIRGEARIIERAFGLDASVLAETVQFASERLALEAAEPAR